MAPHDMQFSKRPTIFDQSAVRTILCDAVKAQYDDELKNQDKNKIKKIAMTATRKPIVYLRICTTLHVPNVQEYKIRTQMDALQSDADIVIKLFVGCVYKYVIMMHTSTVKSFTEITFHHKWKSKNGTRIGDGIIYKHT